MTTLTKKKLLDDLKDKETRELFAEEQIATGLPFQIRALREREEGLTQAALARKVGMAQERISKLEDPDYEFLPKINTLLKLANAFDVPLIVRFGTWRELFDRETNLSPEDLAPRAFEEEVGSLERDVTTPVAAYCDANVISYTQLESVVTKVVQSVMSNVFSSLSATQFPSANFVEKKELSAIRQTTTAVTPHVIYLDQAIG